MNKKQTNQNILRWYWEDSDNPRPTIIRQCFGHLDINIIDITIPRNPGFWVQWQSYLQNKQAFRNADLIYIQAFQNKLIPLAWIITKLHGSQLLFDFFVSQYDAFVNDYKKHKGLQSVKFYLIDWLSIYLPAHVLVDTQHHFDHFSNLLNLKEKSYFVVPVGFDENLIEISIPKKQAMANSFKIVFWGNIIPLQGVDVIIEAARILEKTSLKIEFHIYAPESRWNVEWVTSLRQGLPENISYHGFQPLQEILKFSKDCDLILGIFGNTIKAKNVVPNKVYQGLSTGRPVLTARTPAMESLFIEGQHYLSCGPGNPEELANAIINAIQNYDQAYHIGIRGQRQLVDNFNSKILSEKLHNLINAL
ncbi:MAG: glycosyltransferase [SAR324 cluster bacterium]|nr:glycosyltransferase [SAR324 cluster bacterium]